MVCFIQVADRDYWFFSGFFSWHSGYLPVILARVFLLVIIQAGMKPARTVKKSKIASLMTVSSRGATRIPSEKGKSRGCLWNAGTSSP